MRRVLISTGLILAMFGGIAQASDHWDRPSCYIYVHEQCYPAGKAPQCSPEDYDWGLDQCDGYYPSTGKRPGGLTSRPGSGSPQLKGV